MLKKSLICFGSAVGLLVLCLLLFAYKGSDEVTFFQRQNINQYLADVPFEQDPGGNNIIMPAAVASGTDGYDSDTFLGARNQIDYGTGCAEFEVIVTDEKEVILAQEYTVFGENSVKLSRVVRQFESDFEDCRLVLKLSEYGNLGSLNSLIAGLEKTAKTYITGVHENAVSYVKSFFPQVRVLCDYGDENRLSLEQIKECGADGILCDGEAFNERLLKKAQELGLLVWVDCGKDVYSTVKAMKFGADGLLTERPRLVTALKHGWDEGSFEAAVKETKE